MNKRIIRIGWGDNRQINDTLSSEISTNGTGDIQKTNENFNLNLSSQRHLKNNKTWLSIFFFRKQIVLKIY